MDAFLNDLVIMAPAVVFNIYFALASIPLGFVFAIFLALGKASSNPLINRLSRGYIYAFRGSPLFIQFFMFYSLALSLNLTVWRPLGISGFVLHPLFMGPLVLVLNTAAYTTEIFHGAIKATSRGEIEAARAYGMSRGLMMRRIILPSAFRRALPAYGNEVIFMLHSSVVLSTITLQDILGVGRWLNGRYYLAYEGFVTAMVFYMILVFLISRGFRFWEKHWLAHLRPREAESA